MQKPLKLNKEMENKRKSIVRSFSLAKDLYNHGLGMSSTKESELQEGAEFLEVMHYHNFSVVQVTFYVAPTECMSSVRTSQCLVSVFIS